MELNNTQTLVLETVRGGATTVASVAEVLNTSISTARRALVKLVEAGAVVQAEDRTYTVAPPPAPVEAPTTTDAPKAPSQMDEAALAYYTLALTALMGEGVTLGYSRCKSLRYSAHKWEHGRKAFVRTAVSVGHKEATASANYAAALRGEL
jgi:hypothetical protein